MCSGEANVRHKGRAIDSERKKEKERDFSGDTQTDRQSKAERNLLCSTS